LPSAIEQIHREYKARGLQVLAVNFGEPRDRVARWVKDKQVTFPVVVDPDSTVVDAYRITATPTVYVLDRDGKVVGVAVGTKEWTSPKGRALLDALLTP
jgi:peroxiredoxin